MHLADVKTRSALEKLYREKGLEAEGEKIEYLKETMGVRSVIGGVKKTPSETLASLEEAALWGLYRAFQ
jgi:hypothetical protein